MSSVSVVKHLLLTSSPPRLMVVQILTIKYPGQGVQPRWKAVQGVLVVLRTEKGFVIPLAAYLN